MGLKALELSIAKHALATIFVSWLVMGLCVIGWTKVEIATDLVELLGSTGSESHVAAQIHAKYFDECVFQ